MKNTISIALTVLILTALAGCSEEFKNKHKKMEVENLMKQVKCIDGVSYFVKGSKVTSVKINQITLKPEVCGK